MCDHCVTLKSMWTLAKEAEPAFKPDAETQGDLTGVHLLARCVLALDEDRLADGGTIGAKLADLMSGEDNDVMLDALMFAARIRTSCVTVGEVLVAKLIANGHGRTTAVAAGASADRIKDPMPDVVALDLSDGAAETLQAFLKSLDKKRRKPGA